MTTTEIMNNVYNAISKGIDVTLQDQTSDIIDYYMLDKVNAVELTLAESTVVDGKTLTVVDDTGVVAGRALEISEKGHVFQAIVLSVVDNLIVVNAPFDAIFTANAVCVVAEWNMIVDGSTTSRIFSVAPPVGVKWDITRINMTMTATAAMDDSKFGSLDALTNGVVLRKKNGEVKNIFVVSDNGGIAERCYDTDYPTKVPVGIYAFRARRTFGGQDKNGVVVRLDGSESEELQIIIQDALSGGTLTKFAVVAQGHVVEG